MEDWQHRQNGEMTSVYLARVLRQYLGLPSLAERAHGGEFNEFGANEDPLLKLVDELEKTALPLKRAVLIHARIYRLIDAIRQGEFDGTPEEYQKNRWLYARAS